jgi:hypothetical protein
MNKIDISSFILFKTHSETQELNNEILKKLNLIFPDIDKKRNRNKNKNNVLKTQKILNQKENISNKVNMILNKLSEKNMDSLIIEFINSINQVSKETYEEILKTFYIKIISEINFINIYLDFLKIINLLYNKVQQYNLSFFYDIVENKFKNDYTNYEISLVSNFNFINDLNGETNRLNNLLLINRLIEHKLLSDNIYKYCDNIILNQNIFYSDIYYWFSYKNKKLTILEENKIKEIITTKNISTRDSILLKNMCSNIQDNKNINNKTESQIDTINIESNHIIDEYLMMKSINDIKYFIENRCIDNISKNKFCEILINKYYTYNKDKSNIILSLVEELFKLKILLKSNISKGVLMIHNNWEEISIDYDNSDIKMKSLLNILKKLEIIKGLEHLFN